LRIASIESADELIKEFDDVCLCCGAAVAAIVPYEQIPIQLQGGHVLELKPPESGGLEVGLLGTTYVAPLGSARVMVGPTKEYDATPADARRAGIVDRTSARVKAAESALRVLGAEAYPPCGSWDVINIKYGVRANPPRTSTGRLPLAGRIHTHRDSTAIYSTAESNSPSAVWFAAGLGARGLVYHGLLGQWLAEAILEDDVERIPIECRHVA
jgi:glycine/D-amino acid oxidase-like deaminating enzyme